MERIRVRELRRHAGRYLARVARGETIAQSYGRIHALVSAARRHSRRRLADLMIAAIAAANGLPLYTRNPDDFVGLDSMITIFPV